MKDTKKNLMEFLQGKMDWYINCEPNPFTEMKMVSYINNGLHELHALNVPDDTMVTMYDENETLKFKVEG